ncbi:MAG: GNAT family N-acetyltransferase [Acetobacteraceae bacterium]
MLLARGNTPLNYRRLGRADLGLVEALELDPEQIERFLGPVADIQDAVRHGPAHSMVAIEAAGALVGFYVVHPDPRDAACWWLGWFALDRRQQGRGFGGQAMLAVMDRLRHIPGCRRIRLLVAPDNERARLLYDRAGFCPVSRLRSTGELVLELTLRSGVTADLRSAFMLAIVAGRCAPSLPAPAPALDGWPACRLGDRRGAWPPLRRVRCIRRVSACAAGECPRICRTGAVFWPAAGRAWAARRPHAVGRAWPRKPDGRRVGAAALASNSSPARAPPPPPG